MSVLVIPNSFTSNTLIASAAMNANFNAISTFFNSTGINDANISAGGISHVSLASGSVQKDTLNVNVVDGTTITGGAGTALSILAGGVDLTKLVATVAQALSPTGEITGFAGTAAPAGWLLCNGASVSSTTYAALNTVLGGAYGVGSGVFNLPDLRGRFLRGVDGAAGNDPDSSIRIASNPGGNVGNSVGSLQADAFAAHAHTIHVDTGNAGGVSSLGYTGSGPAALVSRIPLNFDVTTSGGTETRPKNAYVNFIIKT